MRGRYQRDNLSLCQGFGLPPDRKDELLSRSHPALDYAEKMTGCLWL